VISISVMAGRFMAGESASPTPAPFLSVLGELQVRGKTVGELEKIVTDGTITTRASVQP
jgi:hypothetical protein